MKSRQHGMSLIGMIFVALLLGAFLLLGMKMVGPYKEYFALKRIVALVAGEGNRGASDLEIRHDYERRAVVDDIALKSGELIIRRRAGLVVVEAEYVRKVPLVSNISLVFDFKASSQDNK